MPISPRDHSRAAYRVIRWLLLLLMYAAALFLALSPIALRDPDMWWHLRSAQWILSHHAVPHVEPFSASRAGTPWAAYSWAFELLLHAVYRQFYLVGIAAYIAGMAALIAAALYRLASRSGVDTAVAVALIIAAIIAISPILTPRPWLISILFFALELTAIFDARTSGNWRKLLPLIPLFALWANFHIQFIHGLAILALAAAEPLIIGFLYLPRNSEDPNRLPAARWFAVLGACFAATLLTPYGLSLYRTVFTYAGQNSQVSKYVTEMYAPTFRHLGNYFLLLLGLAAAFSLGRRGKLQVFPVLLLGACAVLSFSSQRDAWLLAVASVALIAPTLRPKVGRTQAGYPTALGQAALLVALILITIAIAQLRGINNLALEREVAAVYPVQAVNAVAARQYSGPVLNQYTWGGYLMWRLPSAAVSIDGRADVYGPDAIQRSVALWNGEIPLSDPELQHAGVIIGERNAPLSALLRADSRFELIFEDPVASVFIPRSALADASQSPNKKVAR
jgi:hypothetical protein